MAKKNTFVVFAALIVSFIAASSASIVHSQSADTQAPTVPSGLSATVVPPSGISLSWSGSTDPSTGLGQASGVAGYYVYRNGTIISVNGTSFTDYALVPGVYSYAVAAYDAAGNVSGRSSSVNITLVKDITPPSAPTNPSVTPTSSYESYTSTSSVRITLSWNAATDNVGVAGYYVYRNGTKITTSTTPVTGTLYTDTLPPGAWIYSYQVSAYDASGNISPYSSPATVTIISDVAPPTVPMGFKAEQTSLSGVTLSWIGSTDNIGVAGYDIYRNGSVIGTSVTASYVDSSIVGGNSYSYIVAAYDAAGNTSDFSTPATITVTSDNLPPSIPSGISTWVGSSTIGVSWHPSSDVVAVVGYNIYRNGSKIATVATTSYLDTVPVAGSNMYSITAYNVGGIYSQSSASVSASWYPAATATVPLPTPIVVSMPVATTQPSLGATTSGEAQQTVPRAVASPLITASLFYGIRNDQVSALQSLFSAHGYFEPTLITGFFGNLTQQAVQKFQCDNGIACSGAPGWGIVGPKTRVALNALAGGSASASLSSPSAASLNAEIQALQQQLLNLQSQLK